MRAPDREPFYVGYLAAPPAVVRRMRWVAAALAAGAALAAAVLAVATGPAPAKTSALDGRNFEGVVLERGKTSGDADTLIFNDGRFRSTACDQYGYADGPYTASVSGDTIAFEAETESPKYGKLLWKGVVRGHKLDGTLTTVREGKAAGEKWVVAGETN